MFQSLEDRSRDVAGIRNRSYKNTAYKIHRQRGPPVYLVAECATPLYTLYRVMENKELYDGEHAASVTTILSNYFNITPHERFSTHLITTLVLSVLLVGVVGGIWLPSICLQNFE